MSRRLGILIAVLATGLVLSGCGDENLSLCDGCGPTATPEATPSATSTGPTPTAPTPTATPAPTPT